MTTRSSDPFRISYRFRNQEGGEEKCFELRFDPVTMEYVADAGESAPDWALLESNQCAHCPLSTSQSRYCPVAKNMALVATHFAREKSYHLATVEVTTQERSYLKETSLQEGLFGILGLIMATSGCPHMSFLKPMARLHLPFSSLNETLIRSLSLYLLKQYFVQKNGGLPDLSFDRLEEQYRQVNLVNQGIIARIRSVAKGDAEKNALVILDGFATLLAAEKTNNFSEIEKMLTFENSWEKTFPRTPA